MKRKKIAVLGSTGSVGTQTLDLIKLYPDLFEVKALVLIQTRRFCEQQSNLMPNMSECHKSLYGRESGVVSAASVLKTSRSWT
ncbi:MAG: hypothetical protein ACLTSK_04915 [Christensenellales bacterium]